MKNSPYFKSILLFAICHLLVFIGRFVLVGGLFANLVGCGYTVKSLLPSYIKSIYVERFSNKINITDSDIRENRYKLYHPFLEIDITNKVVDKYLYDGNLRVVEKEDADITLSGELITYMREPVRYSDSGEVEEYRISLYVNLVLKDAKKNEVLWEEKNFVGDTTYFISGSLAKSEETALDDAIDDLARRIVERTTQEW